MNWLLIRGLAREKRHWGEFPKRLENEFQGSQVLCLEIPGVGQKSHEKSLLSIEENVEHLREEFLRLKKESNEPWSVMAISMGGMFAMKWAQMYPEDFAHAFVINSSSSGISPLWDRLTPHALKEFLKIAVSKSNYDREKMVFELTSSKDIDESIVKKWASYADLNPVTIPNFLRQIYSASKFKIPSKLAIPLTVFSGAEDKLASPRCSKKLSEHFNCRLHIDEKSGHDLPLDNPTWIIENIKDIIAYA